MENAGVTWMLCCVVGNLVLARLSLVNHNPCCYVHDSSSLFCYVGHFAHVSNWPMTSDSKIFSPFSCLGSSTGAPPYTGPTHFYTPQCSPRPSVNKSGSRHTQSCMCLLISGHLSFSTCWEIRSTVQCLSFLGFLPILISTAVSEFRC